LARHFEEEPNHTQQLIQTGKERGYLLYDEVNESLPENVQSSQEIDDLLSTLERQGIEVYEDHAVATAARDGTNPPDGHEPDAKQDSAADGGLDLSLGADSQSQDPVRIYLREMGAVPLLNRERDRKSVV